MGSGITAARGRVAVVWIARCNCKQKYLSLDRCVEVKKSFPKRKAVQLAGDEEEDARRPSLTFSQAGQRQDQLGESVAVPQDKLVECRSYCQA